MHKYLDMVPFDLYELHLFDLIIETGSFTKAGRRCGLSQSALTRQIQGMEIRLGVPLFERTTRYLNLTPAGQLLYARSKSILKMVSATLQEMQSGLQLQPMTLKIGVSRSISLAYLPGFFVQFQRKFASVRLQIVQESSA